MFKFALSFVILARYAAASTEPVTDETLRAQALAAIFPGMQISAMPGKAIDSTWRPKNLKRNALTFPDALAQEKVYRVSGKPANEVEQCAAARSGSTREARFRLYMWPGATAPGADWLAVVQYKFTGVSPDFQCLSVPLLLHLKHSEPEWRVSERFLLDPHGHVGIEGIQIVDLTGDGREELVVDSDAGEEEASASEVHIFDLTQDRFDERLAMASRMSASVMNEEQYSQTLDIPRTVKEQGKQFCFVKTLYAEEGKWFPTPRVSRICYPRGRGVDAEETKVRLQSLSENPKK